MVVLLLSLIAHALADFLLQTDRMVISKNRLQLAGFLGHGVVIFGSLVVLLAGYQLVDVLLYSLVITIAHLGIDWFKTLFNRKQTPGIGLLSFVADQLFHILIIFIVWPLADLQPNLWITRTFDALFLPKLTTVLKPAFFSTGFSIEKILCCILGYLFVCWGGAFLVYKFLQFVEYRADAVEGMKNTGNYIGIVERALILTLALNNSLSAVGFIFTAKSIARFNELSNRDFAEYYLVGTLFSTVLAVGGGMAVNYLCQYL